MGEGNVGGTQIGTHRRLGRAWSRYGIRTVPVALALAWLEASKRAAWLRVARLRMVCRAEIGRGVSIDAHCRFSPGARLWIGDHVFIGRNSTFEIGRESQPGSTDVPGVRIGENTWISERFLLQAMGLVQIGRDVLIGEGVSLRDATHAHRDPSTPIRTQGDVLGSIRIEDDAWIGRGVIVQGRPEGTVIGRGAVVGANSVVIGSVPDMEVWGGVPARVIGRR